VLEEWHNSWPGLVETLCKNETECLGAFDNLVLSIKQHDPVLGQWQHRPLDHQAIANGKGLLMQLAQ
jgi:hypothetical protein